MSPFILSPSVLSADFSRLGEEAHAVLQAGANWIHFDVMDQHYVPNLTVGPMVCASLAQTLQRRGIKPFMDVHLMVEPVDALIEPFAQAGASLISFHPEASRHPDRTLQLIQSAGCQVGIALNPATSLDCLDWIMDRVDLILLMCVNPGFGGQSFLMPMLEKIAQVRARCDAYEQKTGRTIRIQVDGGVKVENVADIAQAGADTFVIGSGIFAVSDSDGGYQGIISCIQKALTI